MHIPITNKFLQLFLNISSIGRSEERTILTSWCKMLMQNITDGNLQQTLTMIYKLENVR